MVFVCSLLFVMCCLVGVCWVSFVECCFVLSGGCRWWLLVVVAAEGWSLCAVVCRLLSIAGRCLLCGVCCQCCAIAGAVLFVVACRSLFVACAWLLMFVVVR